MLEPVFAAIRARHADERSPDETSNILLQELPQDIVQTEARSRKRQRTEPADADESPDTTHPSTPDLAAAFAQYRQRCAEAREAYAAAMKQNRQLEKAREMLERTLAVVREEAKTAVARAEESEKLLTTSYKPSWWNNTLTDPDTHERARSCARCTSVYIYICICITINLNNNNMGTSS